MERDWTIPDLAKAAGINKKTVSTVERGEVRPTADTLDYLARALGYSAGAELAELQAKWCSGYLTYPAAANLRYWKTLVKLWSILEPEPESQRVLLGVIRLEAQWVLRHGAQVVGVDTPAAKASRARDARSLPRKTAQRIRRETNTDNVGEITATLQPPPTTTTTPTTTRGTTPRRAKS